MALFSYTFKVMRHETMRAAAILAFIIMLAFLDVVFLGRTLVTSNIAPGAMPTGAYGYNGRRVVSFPVLDPGAPAWDYEPDVKILHDDLARKWLPLWDPYVGVGAPFLANMMSAALSPMRILLAEMNRPAFWDFFLLCRLFVAALFTFLFARSIDISVDGSLIAAVMFALSGHFIYYINMPDLDAQIWLPALALAALKLLQNTRYPSFLLTVALTALIVLAGMPESAFYIFLFTGAFAFAYIASVDTGDGRLWLQLTKGTINLAGAGLMGVLISMPVVLPFLEYLKYAFNPRAPGVGLIYQPSTAAISLLLPHFFGPLYATWNGINSAILLPYIGSVGCLLALAALCTKPSPRFVIFFAGFGTFYLLKAFGSPVVQWVGKLPFFNMTVFPKHAFPEFALCVALLAGMGAESLLLSKVSYLRFALASILLSMCAVLFTLHYWGPAIKAGASSSIIRSCLVLGVSLCGLWVVAWAARRFGPSRILAFALLAACAIELVAFIPRDRADRYNAFTKPPFVDFLHADQQLYRTFSPDLFLFPNTNASYGIDDVRSLDPILVGRYVEFLRNAVTSRIYDRFDGREPGRDFLRSPMLDLMNVKYLLLASDIQLESLIDTVLRDGFVLPTDRVGIQKGAFVIDGVRKDILFQHPPSRIDVQTTLSGAPVRLKSDFALSPEVWSPDKGDGVTFSVDATSLSDARELFSDYIDPKNRASDRKWHMHSIDLNRYRGQEIYLIFQTLSGSSPNFDWAHWAQLPGGIQVSLRGLLGQSEIIAPAPSYVAPGELTIDGHRLDTWLQNPNSTIRFRLSVPRQQAVLNFAIALDPAIWSPDKGDGVTFKVSAAPVQALFTRTIDPKNNRADRKWHTLDVDLSPFRNNQILLSFHTAQGASRAFDWAGWGNLRLEGQNDKFDLAYDREVKIYRNRDVQPRAFVVHSAETISDKTNILKRLKEPTFNFRTSVILENGVPNGRAPTLSTPDDPPVIFEDYEPNYVRVHTGKLTEPGWLVLADMYYPGWKVRVDGRAEQILPADYIFRAVPLDSGPHVVEFIYRPTSFIAGVIISILTVTVLLPILLFLRERARRRTTESRAALSGAYDSD
jgi:hypothetical protein